MYQKLKSYAKYTFCLIPFIVLTGFSHKKDEKSKEPVYSEVTVNINPFQTGLPCHFVSKGIVGSGVHTFDPSSTYPILSYPATANSPSYKFGDYNDATLFMQNDGNVVLVCHRPTGDVNAWSTNTAGSGANQLWFQNDGNLVLMKSSTHTVVWASNIYTTCSGGQYTYINIQDDGNMVVRYPIPGGFPQQSYALGDTGTAGNATSSHNHQIK